MSKQIVISRTRRFFESVRNEKYNYLLYCYKKIFLTKHLSLIFVTFVVMSEEQENFCEKSERTGFFGNKILSKYIMDGETSCRRG